MPYQPITIEEVLEWLTANRKNAAWLAKTIGVSQSTPSRWSKGDPIPAPSQHLLRLLIRGEVPPGFSKPTDPAVLGFTPAEWRVIEIARIREGFSDAKSFIVAKILAYLAMGRATGTDAPAPASRPRITYPTGNDDRQRNALNEEHRSAQPKAK